MHPIVKAVKKAPLWDWNSRLHACDLLSDSVYMLLLRKEKSEAYHRKINKQCSSFGLELEVRCLRFSIGFPPMLQLCREKNRCIPLEIE